MTKLLSNAKKTVIYYKLAIVRFVLFFAQALCGSVMAALAGTQWAQADAQTRFLIVTGIIASLAATLGAFFDKTLARLAPPDSESTSTTITRTYAPPANAFGRVPVTDNQLPP